MRIYVIRKNVGDEVVSCLFFADVIGNSYVAGCFVGVVVCMHCNTGQRDIWWEYTLNDGESDGRIRFLPQVAL